MMLENKTKLLEHCKTYVFDRLNVCQMRIGKIQEDLASETKSSAGDKHETGRAMLQLEREKLGSQLAVIEKDQAFVNKLDIEESYDVVRVGSLVYTSSGNYFIAISAGKVRINRTDYFAISSNTPIGKLLLGKRVGDEVKFRDRIIKIETIV